MKRLIGMIAGLALMPALALGQGFNANVDYRVLDAEVPTQVADGKVEVVELFWYGCPHCYALEPFLESWLQDVPEHVEFVRIPAVFGRNWELDARVYYTFEVMGIVEQLHRPYMDEIHRRGNRMSRPEQVGDFVAGQGIDRGLFLQTFDSFAVETHLRRSQELVRRYRANGVPALIVNGKYEVNGSLARSHERMIQILNHLIEQEAG